MGRVKKEIVPKNGFVSREDGFTADEAMVHNLKNSIEHYNREVGKHDPKTCSGCGRPAPYGFLIDNGHLIPDDAEQDVLRVAHEMKDAGLSTRQVAEELANAGIVPRGDS